MPLQLMPLLTFSCYYSLLIVNLAINFVMQAEYLHKKVPYGLRGNTNNTPKKIPMKVIMKWQDIIHFWIFNQNRTAIITRDFHSH